MGRCYIWGTPQSKDPHQWWYIIFIQAGALQVQQTKIEYKSSTGAKLVAVIDYLPYNIWICLCMVAQGYEIKNKSLFSEK